MNSSQRSSEKTSQKSSEGSNQNSNQLGDLKRSYNVEANKQVLLLTLLVSAVLPFFAGRTISIHDMYPNASKDADLNDVHPSLILHAGKALPQHKYYGIEFNVSSDNGRVVNTHLPSPLSTSKQVCTISENGEKRCFIDNTNDNSMNTEKECLRNDESCSKDESQYDGSDDDDEDEHLPAGQHLLIDIKNVDSNFLDSDTRLAQAMVDVVNLSKLTLLSYHCHSLIPQGVSCVGVLLESHISFHTWPEAGVITLDLFTCGSGKLVPLIPIVESLFATPQTDSLVKPFMRWVHKLRGFRPDDSHDIFDDVGHMFEESLDIKEEVASVQTSFQRIDVFDLHEFPKHSPSPKEAFYKAQNPRLYQPERIVYLDGVIQSTRANLEAYHENLVHPAMFTHKNPKKVAIIGGGEGATLMEVLKHNTVEKVHMIEIDEEMVSNSRTFLPEWTDCSDIIGSEEWCGDDSRAEIYYEDALRWFIDRYSVEGNLFHEHHSKLDLIIMDALDPQDDVPFAEILYTDETFLSSLYDSLEDDGMIIFQLGDAPEYGDSPDAMNSNHRRATLMTKLEELGFESFHIFDDGHNGFEYPWTFFVALKDETDDAAWFRNEAETQIAIHQRTMRTHSGKPVLKYFDGATMKAYQVPHKVFETVFCRQIPTPDGCVFEAEKVADIDISDLEVKLSSVGDGSGRGVFTKVNIKKGSTIGGKSSSSPLYFPPSTVALIDGRYKEVKEIMVVYSYMDGYGWQVDSMGKESYYVDSSFSTFMNHGCNGSFNVGDILSRKSFTEQNAKESDADEVRNFISSWASYNPWRLRHIHQIETSYDYAFVDIKAEEELLTDYLDFQEGDSWWLEVQELKRVCNGEAVGFITKQETDQNSAL